MKYILSVLTIFFTFFSLPLVVEARVSVPATTSRAVPPRRAAKPSRAQPQTRATAKGATQAELSAGKRDMSEYEALARKVDAMNKELERIRRVTDAAKGLVGANSSDARRLQEIVYVYSRLALAVSGTANRALYNSLQDFDKRDAAANIAQADKLSDEVDVIRKGLLCTLEQTCSLK